MRRAAVLALATGVFAVPAMVGAQSVSEPSTSQYQTTSQYQAADQAQVPNQNAPQNATQGATHGVPQSSAVTVPDKTAASQRLLTPEQEGRQGIVKGVVDQSFRDFGMLESRIPRVLVEAMADPYARVTPATCDQLTAEITRLEAALGPDLDAPINTERKSNFTRGKGQAQDAALDAMRSTVQSYIPFDGYIRIVSGATAHDHKVLAAIQAGSVRRAYLKGLGEMEGCAPPATPRHLAHPVAIAAEQPRDKRH